MLVYQNFLKNSVDIRTTKASVATRPDGASADCAMDGISNSAVLKDLAQAKSFLITLN